MSKYKNQFDVHDSVHLGNVYVRLKAQLDAHGFITHIVFAKKPHVTTTQY
jgi:hypothetical protein